ncbi:hypothetical protein [Paenibacillus rhizoplanae]|uniref:hypothetical protein n=1 Tax=Paenibacillus rhizoplanae TaxID=1917181 RepID=UPI0036176BEC
MDPSTIQAVPGIATDPGVTLAKNGTINYSFNGTTPPDKFMLKVSVKELILSDDTAQQLTLAGNWSFEIPVKKKKKLYTKSQWSKFTVVELNLDEASISTLNATQTPFYSFRVL